MESFPNEQTIEDTIENINEDRRRGNPAGMTKTKNPNFSWTNTI